MKKLLALLLVALILLSMPLPLAYAEEEPPADAPIAEASAETTSPELAEPPADPEPAPAEPPTVGEPEKTPDPTPAPPAAEEPAPTEEPGPADTPAPTEEPGPTEKPDPAEEPDPMEKLDPADEPDPTEEPADGPYDQPRRSKSLKYWEKEREKIKLTGDLRDDILTIALSQLGYSADITCYEETASGKRRYYTRYGDWYGSKYIDWCDAFVSFCIYYAGNESYPVESSCARHMMSLKREGYWREWNSYVPEKGDIVFFNFKTENSMPTHVGLVEEVIPAEDGKPGQLITIEGNQRNPNGKTACVRRMVRDLNCVVGYGTYEQGKIYPEEYTVRSTGRTVIKEDSRYFVEYPTEAAMRFLGLVGSRYYEYWFPMKEEPELTEEAPAEEPEAAPDPEPDKKPKAKSKPEPTEPEEEKLLPNPKPPRLTKEVSFTDRDSK